MVICRDWLDHGRQQHGPIHEKTFCKTVSVHRTTEVAVLIHRPAGLDFHRGDWSRDPANDGGYLAACEPVVRFKETVVRRTWASSSWRWEAVTKTRCRPLAVFMGTSSFTN
ncbi:MAG TPA: hypothetical protein VG122_05385 [Gemmata sp.]|nr:hypothetical protein [Gemmata sp.]